MHNISRSTCSQSDMRRRLSPLGFRFNESFATFSPLQVSNGRNRYSAVEATYLLLELQASNVMDVREQLPIRGPLHELAS